MFWSKSYKHKLYKLDIKRTFFNGLEENKSLGIGQHFAADRLVSDNEYIENSKGLTILVFPRS